MSVATNQNSANTSPKLDEKTLAPGDFVFNEGESGDFAYVLVSGTLEICKLSAGEQVVLQELAPGALFGEMALIDKAPRSASVRAKTEAVVREIDEVAFQAHIRRSPDVAINMLNRLTSYVRTSNKNLTGSVFDKHAPISPEKGQPEAQVVIDRQPRWQTNIDFIINEFQSPHEVLENRRFPPVLIQTFWIILLIVVSVVSWASVSVIETTVAARGRLTTTVPTIAVQSTDNATVKGLLVDVGQRVEKGDILFTLDETFTRADITRARIELAQLESKQQRLEAEMGKKGPDAVAEIVHPVEKTVFLNRNREYESRIASFELKLSNRAQKLLTIQKDIDLFSRQLQIKGELKKARQELFDKKVGSLLNLMQAEDAQLTTTRESQQLKNSLDNIKGEIEEIRAEKEAFTSEWFSNIGKELSQVNKDRDAKREDVVKLSRKRKNVVVKAPVSGIIVELQHLFVGAIVTEGQHVISLVPSDVPLTAEIDIDPKDIGHLVAGAQVMIQLDALPFQKHGGLSGEIVFISEDTMDKSTTGKPGTFYRARATIIKNELKELPDNFRLVPGMLLTGDILAGKRRLITYFIYPIVRTMQTTFREPG
ncbi:MAG: HlyD family type I secretion periplasmic adaptor subunit [Magnetococcales bacterium]|nr:HlyD family type I secretion periplasmic adaptor subunit [Magnetococcales bacterium]